MNKKSRLIFGSIVFLATIVAFYFFVYSRITPANESQPYKVINKKDDTLRVVMIGDSWAMFHYSLNRDSIIQEMLQNKLHKPVKFRSRGKGGANSKEIYYYMFSSITKESEQLPDICTQPLLEENPDYCLISAGINDAGQGRGVSFFCENYRYILNLLLYNHIRPVILELPTVIMDNKIDIPIKDFFNNNRSFAKSRLMKRLGYKVNALLSMSDLDNVDAYRDGLEQMLTSTGLMDSVVYIGTKEWNPDGYKDKRGIYLDDGTHLNLAGYDVLDSCYVEAILKDYQKYCR